MTDSTPIHDSIEPSPTLIDAHHPDHQGIGGWNDSGDASSVWDIQAPTDHSQDAQDLQHGLDALGNALHIFDDLHLQYQSSYLNPNHDPAPQTTPDDWMHAFEHLGDFLKDLQSMDHTQMHGWSSQDAPQWQTPTQPETHDSIVGHPQSDMTHWEMQTAPDTCAVVSQKFIIEELTGRHLSQEEVVQTAEQLGIYHPGYGTNMEDIGQLLDAYGLHADVEHGASINDLEQALADGHKVLAVVNGEEIWNSCTPGAGQLTLDQAYGMPGNSPDHCVQVIGIDETHAGGPYVILNDSGTPNGQGLMVPLDEFEHSWATSGGFMVATEEVA